MIKLQETLSNEEGPDLNWHNKPFCLVYSTSPGDLPITGLPYTLCSFDLAKDGIEA